MENVVKNQKIEQLEDENKKIKVLNEEGMLIFNEGSTPLGRKYVTLLKIVDGKYHEIDTFDNTKSNIRLIKAAGFISDLEYTLGKFPSETLDENRIIPELSAFADSLEKIKKVNEPLRNFKNETLVKKCADEMLKEATELFKKK
jgi:hypothetical protein